MQKSTAASATIDSPEAPLTKLAPGDRLEQAEALVRKYSYWSMGIGCVPVPLVDFLGVGAAQVKMISELCALYGSSFSEHTARNVIVALAGTTGGGLVTRAALGSMIKLLPFAGAFVGGVLCMPALAGAATYAVGKVFIGHFESGGTLLTFEPHKWKEDANRYFRAGRKVVVEKP